MRTSIFRLIKLEQGSVTIQKMVLMAFGLLVMVFANKIWDGIKGPVSARVNKVAVVIGGGKANAGGGQSTPGNGEVIGPNPNSGSTPNPESDFKPGNGGIIQPLPGDKKPIAPEKPVQDLVPFSKEFREKFQTEVDNLLRDKSLSDAEKARQIIIVAKSTAKYGLDPHDVVQDLRRKGWTWSDKEKYNSPGLVYSHYYLKGEGLGRQGALGVLAGELGMSFYNDLLKLGGSWLADPWGELDNRPASSYDENNRRWYNQGVYVGWNKIIPISKTQ